MARVVALFECIGNEATRGQDADAQQCGDVFVHGLLEHVRRLAGFDENSLAVANFPTLGKIAVQGGIGRAGDYDALLLKVRERARAGIRVMRRERLIEGGGEIVGEAADGVPGKLGLSSGRSQYWSERKRPKPAVRSSSGCSRLSR